MTLRKSPRPRNLQGVALLLSLLVVGGFLALRLRELPPAQPIAIPLDAPAAPTEAQPSWQEVLQQQAALNPTAGQGVTATPTEEFVPPTLPPTAVDAEAMAFEPAQVGGTPVPTNSPLPPPPSPTPLGPVFLPTATIPVQAVSAASGSESDQWQPPPLHEPLSHDPRDHYWLARPVDSNATNYALFYYGYGSDGPYNSYRVHHGVDMPNPIGERVRAAGPGIVLWAANGFRVEDENGNITEFTTSYGNTVLIQHDFSYRGEPMYTLYAHMSAILVTRGQRVQTGDIIGLVGDTGQVTGPHVHLEVRIGRNSWYSTRNPLLWIVPYIGHGTIVGRVIGPDGELLADQDISVIDRSSGRVVQTTTSYIPADTNNDRLSDILPDDIWDENFVLGDVPEGRYQVVTRIDGERVAQIIDVYEGTTAFVELKLAEEATPQVPEGASQP